MGKRKMMTVNREYDYCHIFSKIMCFILVKTLLFCFLNIIFAFK
jgi:hypothetical protein